MKENNKCKSKGDSSSTPAKQLEVPINEQRNNVDLLRFSNSFNAWCKLHHVYCNKAFILVELPLTSNRTEPFHNTIYWENLRANSLRECQPLSDGNGIIWKINLNDFNKCGFLRSVNKWKNYATYYQNLIIKQKHNAVDKINIKCLYKIKNVSKNFKHKLVKRDVLPEDFQEDQDIEILDTVEQQAPDPKVLMEVRQNDQIIDGMVTVIPGTPLIMEIKLNEEANNIYGLGVNYLQVTDMAEMSETILFKGCTVDPYLFENFNLTDTNSLKSKFRAFKFPNTAFVQFRANIKVCLNNCAAPQCIAGSTKQSRKRRAITNQENDVFDINTSFTLKINLNSKGHEGKYLQHKCIICKQ
ncbi:uncharacterized protein LOC135961465 [Calliphora vicina]|uniref:uncharacterized protein LOC135961465 n=1 Tax=Calliphora vicina TaxID=7373 RepID=UPI00325B684A